jgi:DeoR/GlpR family transcriptional regulator of sugar metabolism
MIHYLSNKKNITVIIHSFRALCLLRDYKKRGMFHGEILFLGGMYDAVHDRISGVLTERMLDSFHADKAFISIDGIQLRKGITGFHAERGQLARQFMEHAEQSIVMTDSSKIGAVKMFKMADLKEVDIIISDVEVPSEWKESLDNYDTAWIWASEITKTGRVANHG